MNNKATKQNKKFPKTPGVYQFIGRGNEVLYVGRAINLNRRLLNYFQKQLDPRLKEMVALAKKIKFVKTANLLEAVILEANLIKKYWPKYNIKDRDNRSFIYIVIPKKEYTRPFLVRGHELQKLSSNTAKVFGPYQSLSLINHALKIIRRIFPYSTCIINSGKPCFDYQIGLCPGACVSVISAQEYRKNINNIILLLSGKKKALFRKLKKDNPEQARALTHIQDVALLEKSDLESRESMGSDIRRIEAYDISHLSGKETVGSMVVFTNGQPNKSQYRLFKIKKAPSNDDLRSLAEVIERRFHHQEWPWPDLILIDGGKPQIDFIYPILRNRQINIPLVGISKLQGDKLVFPVKSKLVFKTMTEARKGILLQAREEAHRFAINFSRKQRKKYAHS
jgi:excinuclease ABC subunit C